MNRLRKLLLISVPATVLAGSALVIGVELWTRLRWDDRKGTPGFFISHPVRLQQLSPGYTGWFAGVPVRINQLGFRDARDYALEKSPRTIRILVLGDSVTFGHGSIYEHSYPLLLEQRLKAWRPDVDWQVWNLGVPGYNTSQELAQLLELGPAFKPDLVIVGFYENDIIDNFPLREPSAAAAARSAVLSWLYRHVYSIEFYKRLYLQLAWRFSGQNSYRLRLAHVAEEEQLTAVKGLANDLPVQQLTAYERRAADEVAATDCSKTPSLPPDLIASMQREPGWNDWIAAVQQLQQLNRDHTYSIAFFANVAPRTCEQQDVFMDGGSQALNRFYLSVLSDGTPAVSAYDAFVPLRPSQMPDASGHSLGNANAVKADVLFAFVRDQLLPARLPQRATAIFQSVQSR